MKSPIQVFDPQLGVHAAADLSFHYDPGVFGPQPELRRLDAIRPSLRDPHCTGPDPVYSIVMDVGRDEHRAELHRRMLLFGVVIYAAGRLGREPVRSQGHIHAIAPHCGWSTPELFEIWEGRAIIYAQEFAAADDAAANFPAVNFNDPGRCIAIHAAPGDQVVVPPGWAHAVINADPDNRMTFGAWCDRQYGFVYDGIRAHHGLAWFPILNDAEADDSGENNGGEYHDGDNDDGENDDGENDDGENDDGKNDGAENDGVENDDVKNHDAEPFLSSRASEGSAFTPARSAKPATHPDRAALPQLRWEPNPHYTPSHFTERQARPYPELGLDANTPIYTQFAENPERVQWVSEPAKFADLWKTFEP